MQPRPCDDNFGRCPVCGGVGKNDPDPGSAFSTEDHTGVGYTLHYYQGELMCQLCIKRKKKESEDYIEVEKRREAQELRDRFGWRRSMQD